MSNEPEGVSDWTGRCPLCNGTGTVTSPDPFQSALQHQAATTSIGAFPDRLEILRKDGADCLSHLPNDVFAARESLCNYLFSAYDLMYFLGVDRDTCEVLRLFQIALEDLQRGVENPLFATEKKARAKSYIDLQVLICASAAISALIDDGKSEEEASKVVAKKLKDNGLPLPDSYQTCDDHAPRHDWERLQEWRRKCSSGRHGELARLELDSSEEVFDHDRRHGELMWSIDRLLERHASTRSRFNL